MNITTPVISTSPINEVEQFTYLSPINLTLAVYILIQNSMIVYNYHKDWRKISALLFILIAVMDIGTACSELGKGSIALLCLRNENLQIPQWTYLTCMSLNVACHVTSTFLAVVLTVVKTIKIVNPFGSLKELTLKVVLLAVISINLVLFISDTWNWNDLFHLANPHPKCSAVLSFWNDLVTVNYLGQGSVNSILIKFNLSNEKYNAIYKEIEISFLSSQFLLPGLIVFVCMIIQMVFIKRSLGGGENPMHNDVNRANITVFLISMLYLVSVGIFSVYLVVDFPKHLYSEYFPFGNAYYIIRFTLPLLNAALFPTILIARKPDLRAKYLSYIEAVCCLPCNVFRRVRQRAQRREGYTQIRGSEDDE